MRSMAGREKAERAERVSSLLGGSLTGGGAGRGGRGGGSAATRRGFCGPTPKTGSSRSGVAVRAAALRSAGIEGCGRACTSNSAAHAWKGRGGKAHLLVPLEWKRGGPRPRPSMVWNFSARDDSRDPRTS